MAYRIGLFQRRGWDQLRAEAMAQRLAIRDRERDDLRACIECAHLTRSFACTKRQPVLPDVLQRCFSFSFQTPNQ